MFVLSVAIVGLAFLSGAGRTGSRVKPAAFRLAMGLAWFSLLLLSSCGGEGIVTPLPGGTPAGIYPITVTATAGSVVDTVHLTRGVESRVPGNRNQGKVHGARQGAMPEGIRLLSLPIRDTTANCCS